MKNKMLAALAVLVALPLFAQQGSSPQGSTQDTAALEQHIKDLEERLIALEGQVRILKSGQAAAAAPPVAAQPAATATQATAQTAAPPTVTVPTPAVTGPAESVAPSQLPNYGGASASATFSVNADA